LIKRLERIGIGSAVGACFASKIETANIPAANAGLDKGAAPLQILQTMNAAAGATTIAPSASVIQQLEYDPTATNERNALTENDRMDSAVSVDDILDDFDADEDTDEPTGHKNKAPLLEGIENSAFSVPFLSKEDVNQLRKKIVAARKEWLQTASNVRVEQVVEEVRANAACTYDYLMYVVCAATVAAVGLATDSATTTIASMLISPIMGPVMGFTFGTTVRNKGLILVSLRNEVFSLVVCVLIGLFWGVICAVGDVPFQREWPSQEMLGRGDKFGLVSGVFIAIPSGIATALSTLGQNSSGMTGVAISLSLLPPAVNAGLCWAYGAMLTTPGIVPNEGDDTDYFDKGNISISLTLINIVCIWVAGTFAFWLKEVVPVQKKNAFWVRDVAEYRKQRRTAAKADPVVLNDGMRAAMELRQELGAEVLEDEFNTGLTKKKIGAARRGGLASNALEDALHLDNNFGMDGLIVPGGVTSSVVPDNNLENIRLRKTQRHSVAELIENATQNFGGLSPAGAALFDDTLMGSDISETASLPSDADGVDHDGVAVKLMLQKYD
ncbi:MAG: hypothetical protein SGILL_008456, partial [Bacillariaceae sp.]